VKAAGYLFAGLLVLIGLVFCVAAAATGVWPRWVLGGVLLAAGLAVVYFLRMKVPDQKVEVVQKIDFTGEEKLKEIKCRNCGGTLDAKAMTVSAGAVFVKCPYCGSGYQIEEAPKW
jgi:DNA-directed RNA polymerase subunit RPC12/RpoP